MKPLRKCRECGLEAHTEEELELFVKDKSKLYDRSTICKKCASEKSKKWYNENTERAIENNKKWRNENIERDRERAKKWYNENTERVKEREKNNREALKQYIGGTYKCKHCGFEHPTSAPFDFHHINPDEKEGEIGRLVHGSLEKLLREVDKCVLLCATCHRLEHERLKANESTKL
jgi:hypothetical protein